MATLAAFALPGSLDHPVFMLERPAILEAAAR